MSQRLDGIETGGTTGRREAGSQAHGADDGDDRPVHEGILVLEDGNLMTGGSVPHSGLHWFPELFGQIGAKRGVDYGVADRLFHLVRAAGFPKADIFIHQLAAPDGEERWLLYQSVEEIGPALVDAGLLTADGLKDVLAEMQAATDDPDVLVLMPRMWLVWARKS